ncbi:MAG: GTP 3',8-cyclase MoaA [Methanosarcinales archaeon]|nr:GTP 3',8-cyclase MoaA [Methanosarcinales archaeon]
MTLVDPFGRQITGLRMALTPRCNLRCIYCHHEGEVCPEREISRDMAANVVKAASQMGIRVLKITGGEPLMRGDLEDIVASCSSLPSPPDISITTNGILLAERAGSLAEAGLQRANISLDSLNPETYRAITRGREGDLERVLAGVDAALEAGLGPVKLNMVLLQENQDEVYQMMDLAREKGLVLQLIELLDLKGHGLGGDMAGIEQDLAAKAEMVRTREMHRRKKYFVSGAEVEVVRPMDNTEFCAHCHRLRVTSDGKLKPCLLRSDNLVEIGTKDVEEIKARLQLATARRAPYFFH